MGAVTDFLLDAAGVKGDVSTVSKNVNASFGHGQAERDAFAKRIIAAEGGVDPIEQPMQSQEQWSARIGGEAPQSATTEFLLSAANEEKPQFFDVPGSKQETRVKQDDPKKSESALDTAKGIGEAVLSIGTGLVAAPLGAAAGLLKGVTGGKYGTAEGAREASARAAEIARSLTYTPRTETGQDIVGTVGKVLDVSKLQGLGPTEAMTLGALATSGPRAAVRASPKMEAAPNARYGSAGSAGTNLAEQAKAISANASPELQAIVSKVGENITPRGLEALERQVKANKFGIDLSEGQATRNSVQITKERNSIRDQDRLRFQEQDKKLREAPQVIQEVVAPDVYVANPSEIGDLIIGGYQKKGNAMRSDTSAKYKALEDANGGQFPLDGKALVQSTDSALHKKMLFEHVPDKIRAQLSRIEKEGMTFEQFEAMRTNLAAIQRGGNPEKALERAAAGVIRGEMEKLPMPLGAEHLKPLADAARASSKSYHDALKADPTFKAVERGKAKADNFIQKYIVRSEVDSKEVAKMKENLAHDPIAQQAMAAGLVQKLKESAGILRGDESFSQANYNKALAKLGSKVDVVFTPEGRSLVRELGDVAHDVKFYPHGHAVNTSGSGIMVLGEIAKAGGAALEGIAEAKGIPAGFIKRTLAKRKENKALDKAFQRGAGITIKDVAEAANR